MMTEIALAALRDSHIASKILTPDSSEYKGSLDSYWSAQEARLRPCAIIAPENVTDVAEIVKVLTKTNVSTDFQCPFAIRSGGHQPWAGSANISNGITIDLRGLNSISINTQSSEVTVGAGNRWGSVYKALAQAGMMTIGGRVAHVGVAGLVLGGGLSYFSPESGMVCDNVVDFEIVIAGGEILRANDFEHQELFRSLKGGGNNFGIVTSITLKTTQETKLWGGRIIYEYKLASQMLRTLAEAVSEIDAPFDRRASVFIAISYHHEYGLVALNSLKYTKPIKQPRFLDQFIPPTAQIRQNTMRFDSLLAMVEEEGSRAENGLRRMFYGISCRSDPNTLESFLRLWETSVESIKDFHDVVWTLIFNPILPPASTAGQSTAAGNCLGIDRFDAIITVALSATWTNEHDDEQITGIARGLFADFEAEARQKGTHVPFIYSNYAWEGQAVMNGYGEENLRRLQATSEKYDPIGLFQKAVPGGFKVYPRHA